MISKPEILQSMSAMAGGRLFDTSGSSSRSCGGGRARVGPFITRSRRFGARFESDLERGRFRARCSRVEEDAGSREKTSGFEKKC